MFAIFLNLSNSYDFCYSCLQSPLLPTVTHFLCIFAAKTRIAKGYVESDVRLDGKTTVITGCNTGVGYATALDFARRGARVLMACRDSKRAEDAKAKVRAYFENRAWTANLPCLLWKNQTQDD